MPRRVEIDVYSDIVCPWCFIGVTRLEAVIASLRGSADVAVRHHPFVLQPDAPPEGLDLPAMLRERYGTDPKQMFAHVEAAAREAGLPLDLSKQPRTYSTVAAHTLLRHAAEKGTQHELARALFGAYFLDGRNVADPAVLADVAVQHGFRRDEVERLAGDERELARTEEDVRDASRRGIRGVPLFIFNGRHVLVGAQPAETFRETIEKAAATAAPLTM